MLETQDNAVLESLATALETLAFISVMPPEGPVTAPPRCCRLSIPFSGPQIKGEVQVLAPMALGIKLAANVMGIDPDHPEAEEKGIDALKELANISCGVLLGKQDPAGTGKFRMEVPRFEELPDSSGWDGFVAAPGVQVVDAEGDLIAIGVKEEMRLDRHCGERRIEK